MTLTEAFRTMIDQSVNLPFVNYLDRDNKTAFYSALSSVVGNDFPEMLKRMMLKDNGPVSQNPNDPLETYIEWVSTIPTPRRASNDMYYRRLSLADYFDCCPIALPKSSEVWDATDIYGYLLNTFKVNVDPYDMQLSSITPAVDDPSVDELTVTIASTNYVWWGQLLLRFYDVGRVELLPRIGLGRGLELSDVL